MKQAFIILMLSLGMTSCDLVFFKNAQPVDRPDLLETPIELRGSWEHRLSSIYVYEDCYTMNPGQILKYDKRDTLCKYTILNEHIYIMRPIDCEGPRVVEGEIVDVVDDTVFYRNVDSLIHLSSDLKLRQVGNGFVLNERTRIRFWHINYLQVTDSTLLVLTPGYGADGALDENKILFMEDDVYYTMEDLTSEQMIEQIERGLWDTVVLFNRTNHTDIE